MMSKPCQVKVRLSCWCLGHFLDSSNWLMKQSCVGSKLEKKLILYCHRTRLMVSTDYIIRNINYGAIQIIRDTLGQGCTTEIASGPKNLFWNIHGPKLISLYPFRGCFFQANRLNGGYFGLCGPNKKLPRATFGPRAVSCAHLP